MHGAPMTFSNGAAPAPRFAKAEEILQAEAFAG